MVLALGGGLGGDEGRVLQGRFHGVLPRTFQRFGALGGQPGVSTPNCFACSAFNRCQPPNFMASAPTMRPTGSPARSRSRTSKQMCQPAAPHEIKRRSVVPEREARAAAERLELPPEVAATPAVLEQPRRLGPLHGGLGDLRRRRPDRRELHRPPWRPGSDRRRTVRIRTGAQDRSAPATPSPAGDGALRRG